MLKRFRDLDTAAMPKPLALLCRRIDLVLCFLSLAGSGAWFQLMYHSVYDSRRQTYTFLLLAAVLILAWSLLFTGIAALLPRLPRRVYMGVLGAAFFILSIVHGIYFNMFRKLFSFADMAFAGDGFAFLDSSYLVIRKLAILLGLLSLLVMIAGVVLSPKEAGRARPRLIGGGCGVLAGLALMLGVYFPVLRGGDLVIWDMSSDPAAIYLNFTDTRASMSLLGLYHYTFRDLQLALFPAEGHLSKEERAEIEAYAQSRPHMDNEITGKLAGKNLILVQLEAIDTWMLDYMPALQAVKEHSVSFSNHYTPAYITAGTFNTEFIVNTGLLPAATGTPTSVYTRNSYPYSLANLFRARGYATNSFHGSEGNIYMRADIHRNLGYEAYHSGSDMQMPDYTMDSQLMLAYDDITGGDPFFSFIITYSGHGPYSSGNSIYQAHAEEAQAAAKRSDGNYVYAVGHAMETDRFVKELMARLEEDGLLESTAVVFYADHYNYYMMNDDLQMDIKGVDSLNMLQHTDFFVYSKDLEPRAVEKYTSSLDVLPTLANLFGLDAGYGLMAGDDAFSDAGGYVMFNDNTWTGTERDVAEEILRRRQISALLLKGDYWDQ